MAKRLFSTDKRAETILAHLREKDENLSAYISASVVDEYLPVYSELRIEGLYLLDYITDGAKEWQGARIMNVPGEDDVAFYTMQTLGRGIAWLKRNHHIKNCDVIRSVIGHYHSSPWNGGVSMNDLALHIQGDIERTRKLLKEVDPEYNDFHIGLGSVARDVLDHWESLWDCDEAYDVLIDTIYLEKPLGKIDPFYALKLLQAMETQFIVEAIGERRK